MTSFFEETRENFYHIFRTFISSQITSTVLISDVGAVLLDHEGKDMTNVMSSIVDELVNIGYINEDTG